MPKFDVSYISSRWHGAYTLLLGILRRTVRHQSTHCKPGHLILLAATTLAFDIFCYHPTVVTRLNVVIILHVFYWVGSVIYGQICAASVSRGRQTMLWSEVLGGVNMENRVQAL